MTRHFLTGAELTGEEVRSLVARAGDLKRAGEPSRALACRSVALIFERPSTRTRISMEVAVSELGGHPVVLREGEMQTSRGESRHDTGLVLSRYVQVVALRTGAHEKLEEMAASASVPVVNLLSDLHHPCQALADLLTLEERFGTLAGLRLAYVGDGNNVAHSLMVLGARVGVHVSVATPRELAPDPDVVALAEAGAAFGGSVTVGTDPGAVVRDAHALYTDVWVSMGDETVADERRAVLEGFRIDEALLEGARPDAVVLHCLPAHPGEEITEGVLYGERSAVWDQAENRLHAQKALLELLVAQVPADL